MIYDQFQRLHPDIPRFREAGQPEFMTSQSVVTKPITSLLLVNKRISSEYRDTCEKRSGVIVSTYMDLLALNAEDEEEISLESAEKSSFIHMHAGDWINRLFFDDPDWSLWGLENWFAYWNSQMPNLDSMTVSIYLHLDSIESDVDRKELEDALEEFVDIVPKLRELKVIIMDNAMDWSTIERGPTSKKLLVHWTPSSACRPTLIDCPQRYAETCCQSLVRTSIFDSIDSSSDSSDSSSDSDDSIGDYYNSSRHSNQGDHSDHDDGDDSNESDDDDDDDKSKNNDGDDDAGNGSRGDADYDDKEYEENANEDANQDSDDLGSGGAGTTIDPKTKQAPSYFDFFALPSEIRDMIYDQPEMLEQETPLHHFEGIYYSSLPMGAIKPRTSLLLGNHQFSSEYKARCEGRSGLVISDRMSNFIYGGWAAEVGMSARAAENVAFMHIHVGDFMSHILYSASRIDVFEDWLEYWLPQMPKLETITVSLYTHPENFEDPEDQDLFMRHLERFVRRFDGLLAVEELTELKVILMKDAGQWQSKDEEKHLLVHWERASAAPPQLMYPPLKYEEKCCHDSFVNDTEVYDSLPHNWEH